MLHLHQSNRVENLFDALLQVIAQPIEDVFMAEIIAVEELGMARWLAHGIAERQGIVANTQFPLPAGFIWSVLSSQFGAQDLQSGFTKSTLLWHAMSLLPELADNKGFEDIKRYLSASDRDTRIYQLSRQIAELFDQYLIYRPEMILQWEAGKDEGWQSDLWRAMRQQSTEPHWVELTKQFAQRIDQEGIDRSSLPQRVSLFALTALSPGYVDLLGLLGRYIDVHLFMLNPSTAYWGDIVSEKDLAQLRAGWRQSGRDDVSEFYQVGNPLLASMGKPCRDFLDQWHDLEPDEREHFAPVEEKSLLSCVQADIFHLQNRGSGDLPTKPIVLDASLQVHACHSPIREVQVLHDRLLKLFDTSSEQYLENLTPQDIVVMAPDIDQYTTTIEAVFGTASENWHMPYCVANQSLGQQPLVETLLQWLRLPEERFEASTVLGWLELAAVKARLRLHDEAIERIRDWVGRSGIRWGLDAAHKQDLGLPGDEHNTWQFGFRRLNLGYAMSDEVELFRSWAPFGDIEGAESEWLGQLEAFIQSLASWRNEIKRPATPVVWQERINRLIDHFFLPDDQEQQLLDHVRGQLAEMVASAEMADFADTISADILHQHLSAMLAKTANAFRLLSGGVSFSDMVSLRSIPFRVVCLLGMNDGQFPRDQRPAGFDLIARHPRKGDRLLRNDDRYLFLQSLLAAREVLHISYVGHSQLDNSQRLPSVVISELLDYSEQAYSLETEKLRDRIHLQHPLQPFSPRNFIHGSYAGEWRRGAQEIPPFADEALPDIERDNRFEHITIDSLTGFLLSPCRHFLEKALGIRCAEYSDALEDSERFELDTLQAYALKSELLSVLIGEQDQEKGFELLSARGELPLGESGRMWFEASTAGLPELAQRIQTGLEEREPAKDVLLEINGLLLSGILKDIVDGGLLRYRAAKVNEKDKLRLWVEHLVLAAMGKDGESIHLGLDKHIVMQPVEQTEAMQHLKWLMDIYREGLARPIPLLPKSSLEYAVKFVDKGAVEALQAARTKWDSSEFARGDNADPWIAQAFRDLDPYGEEFEHHAQNFLVPMIRHMGK
jgi:exodeoxyribonuclease V gamma subunit